MAVPHKVLANNDPESPGIIVELTAAEIAVIDKQDATWVADKPDLDRRRLRIDRNILLAESDWTQSPDSPLSDKVKTSWSVHRQELRDLPATTDDPADPTWPIAPE